LADVYVSAEVPERERLGAAAESLNHRLRLDPFAVGESRTAGFRVTFIPLLAVLFHVSEEDRIVRVTRVKRDGK
jgi:hypothetical protein